MKMGRHVHGRNGLICLSSKRWGGGNEIPVIQPLISQIRKQVPREFILVSVSKCCVCCSNKHPCVSVMDCAMGLLLTGLTQRRQCSFSSSSFSCFFCSVSLPCPSLPPLPTGPSLPQYTKDKEEQKPPDTYSPANSLAEGSPRLHPPLRKPRAASGSSEEGTRTVLHRAPPGRGMRFSRFL